MYKKQSSLFMLIILVTGALSAQEHPLQEKLLINHVGYPENGEKKVVFQTQDQTIPKIFIIIDDNKKEVLKGTFIKGDKIDNWHTGKAYIGYFNELKQPGKYKIITHFNGKIFESTVFEIKQKNILKKALPLMLSGLQSQHPEQKVKDRDSNIPFYGSRKDSVDVHGGWYDASGDHGKYLSHLAYSNYLTPQQTPLLVYNLFTSAAYIENDNKTLANELVKEALYGADFLVRMQDKDGYFYTNIFDNWAGDPGKRYICAFEGLAGTKTENYQAAFREGGGITIAALAKLSSSSVSGEFSSAKYLETAEKGFAHLLKNNLKYCDNGEENIIDDYCALMAASELYIVTDKKEYLEHAQYRAANLINRLSSDSKYSGWFRADKDGVRSYYHAVEAGYPIIALCKYLDIEKDKKRRNNTIKTIQKTIDFELTITNEVYNPFGYPRQYIKATNEENKRSAFFMPHHNETGYWYQGENARIASIAAAFNIAKPYIKPDQKPRINIFVRNQINWILGLNPYDVCMLDGLGHNNPKYIDQYNRNYHGGISNGITAGVDNESDIAYLPKEYKDDLAMNWRWPEQWIPHVGWFMLAITSTK